MVLLALLGTRITRSGRESSELARNARAAAEAEAEADGLVHEAAFHLLDAAPTATTGTQDRWTADGAWRPVRVTGGRASVRIEDEAGKLNPNTAQPELLQALLTELGADRSVAEQLPQAIVDWRFRRLQTRPNSATEAEYRALGRAYGPPSAPFETLAELGHVLGMTPELLARLVPHLSLYGSATPDPRVADPLLLKVLTDIGGRPQSPSNAPPTRPQTVTVTARVSTDTGGAFTRRATIRFVTRSGGLAMRTLLWETEAMAPTREDVAARPAWLAMAGE
ncbi:MAG: hypothetical protein NVSMB18_34640 [Acetobacteraceae bacterium]